MNYYDDQTVKAAAEHEQRYLELRDEGLDDAAARAALKEFTAYWLSHPWPAHRAWLNWKARRTPSLAITFSVSTERLIAAVGKAHASILLLARSLGVKICGPQCFCHPAPFPAARDYRRRTKHRRRRQR